MTNRFLLDGRTFEIFPASYAAWRAGFARVTALDDRSLGRWRNAVMAAFALGGVAVSTWGPRLPQLRADLGVDNAVVGLVLAAVTVGSVAGLVAASALLSWLGSRRGICVLLCLIGTGIAVIGISAGLAHSVAFTTTGFALVGFGIGAVDVMINVERRR